MRTLLSRYFVLRYGVIAACLAAAGLPARATSNHQYAKDEYGIIHDGLAPGKQLSLASHGEGELGDEDFHVWLMAEPAHRKIAALEAISSPLAPGSAALVRLLGRARSIR